jgi:hypothetical protein
VERVSEKPEVLYRRTHTPTGGAKNGNHIDGQQAGSCQNPACAESILLIV